MTHKEEAEKVLAQLSLVAKAAFRFMVQKVSTKPHGVTPGTMEELASAGIGKWYDGPTFNYKTGEAKDAPDPGQRYFVLTGKGKRIGKFV